MLQRKWKNYICKICSEDVNIKDILDFKIYAILNNVDTENIIKDTEKIIRIRDIRPTLINKSLLVILRTISQCDMDINDEDNI